MNIMFQVPTVHSARVNGLFGAVLGKSSTMADTPEIDIIFITERILGSYFYAFIEIFLISAFLTLSNILTFLVFFLQFANKYFFTFVIMVGNIYINTIIHN